ncbi:MAG: FKBP-type peptidyl-prolyl cis-trans isomerase [Acidobacteriota bacterium]|nr:FKBP-type peptidyl-prolyl cis-trans isomerase [Acidobacteriota bacterium]
MSFESNGQTKRAKTAPRRAVKTVKQQAPTVVKSSLSATTTASGLTYIITRKGAERLPKKGETVAVHYTGTLTNGVKFDSSRDRDEPITFELGAGRVIKGWDEGIARMHVGDQAIFIIPPQLGYGAKGAGEGAIPPDATLIFIVELVEVRAK